MGSTKLTASPSRAVSADFARSSTMTTRAEHCRQARDCNLDLKAQWHVGQWRAPAFAEAVCLRSAFPMPAWAPSAGTSIIAALGVPDLVGDLLARRAAKYDRFIARGNAG
jgi:hypothetical protein